LDLEMTTDANGIPRVLIVDDDKVIAITLAHIFVAKGYEARSAYSAEEAIPLIDGWVPDLAVLDVCLPGMDGVDLAIRLKAMCARCRVLLISGKPETLDLVERAARGGHALELIAKPVPPAQLLDRAAELLR